MPVSSATSVLTNDEKPDKLNSNNILMSETTVVSDNGHGSQGNPYQMVHLKEYVLLPVIIQVFTLAATVHIAYERFPHSSFNFIWKIVFFGCAQLFKNYSNLQFNGNDKYTMNLMNSLFRFELVYVFYLPFMLSLLFKQELIDINSILTLNSVDTSILNRLAVELFFLFFSTENKTKLKVFAGAIILNTILHYVLTLVSQLKSLDNIDCNLFSILLTNILYLIRYTNRNNTISDEHIPYNVLWGTLCSFLIVISFNCFVSFILTHATNKNASSKLRSLIIFTNFVICFPLLTNYLITDLDTYPVVWLYHYLLESSSRQKILLTWLAFLTILVPNILIFKSNFSLNTSRKVWHFLILLLIIQPFETDPVFVKIALAGTTVLFLSVEYLRYLKLEPFGNALDIKLRSFADFRDDKGPIIISYIYLIIGISAPLLMSDSPVGLISLGVGDSTASIIGKKIGHIHWPNTSKTIEGTVAFISTTFITGLVCKHYLNYFQELTNLNWLIVCTLSGILEGNSILNDNILIPAFMLICEKLLTT